MDTLSRVIIQPDNVTNSNMKTFMIFGELVGAQQLIAEQAADEQQQASLKESKNLGIL